MIDIAKIPIFVKILTVNKMENVDYDKLSEGDEIVCNDCNYANYASPFSLRDVFVLGKDKKLFLVNMNKNNKDVSWLPIEEATKRKPNEKEIEFARYWGEHCWDD